MSLPIYAYNNYRIINGNVMAENTFTPFCNCNKYELIVMRLT